MPEKPPSAIFCTRLLGVFLLFSEQMNGRHKVIFLLPCMTSLLHMSVIISMTYLPKYQCLITTKSFTN